MNVCQYPYAAPIGSEIGVGHRERCRWGEDIAENIAICLWRHRVDAIGGCVVIIGGATAYRSMSVVWGQIYEQRLNLRRSWQQGHSTPYNTLFLAKSSAEDLSLSIFRLKSCMALGRSLLLRM
jgi:hypothetical protein